jgi:hypothetical protein
METLSWMSEENKRKRWTDQSATQGKWSKKS